MQVDEITFPVAETFYSIQGEGLYAGTPMFFIRLAGCNVGRYQARVPLKREGEIPEGDDPNPFQIHNPQYSTCTSYSGTQFVCDTDYRVKERMTIQDLLDQIPEGVEHISITGGEPLIHKYLPQLVERLQHGWKRVNIETSGTLPLNELYKLCAGMRLFITCSPKRGILADNAGMISQWKILVETEEDVKWIESCKWLGSALIFIQPIEHYDANGPIKSSYDFVVDVVKKHPTWRLSLQLHKILGVR